ncbi:MAG: CRISPR-associated endonuclease Cas3'', partial [Pyrinomonadaceae bacterium]
MCKLISHPDILLYDHLNDVGTRAAKLILKLRKYLKLEIKAEDLAKAAFITGICHDFGKAKEQFQSYIRGEKTKNKEHAAISSVFAFVVASQVFKDAEQPTRLLPFICSYTVNRHHGLLRNILEVITEEAIENEIQVAKGKIKEEIWKFEFTLKIGNEDLKIKFADYKESFDKLKAKDIYNQFSGFYNILKQSTEVGQPLSESRLIDLYFALLLIVSVLTESDVACVIGAPELESAKPIVPKTIESYTSKLTSSTGDIFQKLRHQAWEEIRQASTSDILRLTLPTGLGKTLMGFYLSGKINKQTDEINEQTGE